ncbi:hypothetical protein PsYK624_062940 [Phanerochaete sordida]|uniref:Uncharacterized protein n=1 Tax=Phanerochaete sordida TaxID=48140 RepID=A0A9P3G6H6_9APHY|nr:hypothetical protein PsYK624_062940 [Phanerochaete sordida]
MAQHASQGCLLFPEPVFVLPLCERARGAIRPHVWGRLRDQILLEAIAVAARPTEEQPARQQPTSTEEEAPRRMHRPTLLDLLDPSQQLLRSPSSPLTKRAIPIPTMSCRRVMSREGVSRRGRGERGGRAAARKADGRMRLRAPTFAQTGQGPAAVDIPAVTEASIVGPSFLDAVFARIALSFHACYTP